MIFYRGELEKKIASNRPKVYRWPLCPNAHLLGCYSHPCILIWHVINANTLAQHVRFKELPSGFDSGSPGVVVVFYNRPVVMEKAPWQFEALPA